MAKSAHISAPKPNAQYPMFMAEGGARCADADPELFSGDGYRQGERHASAMEAATYCHACPLQVKCLAWGVATKQTGVYGARMLRDGREVRA